MSTIIKYGNYDFGSQPTPFVTRSENFIKAGENWGTQEVFNLRGQITGCDFNALRSGQKDLISGFGQDFQNLEIIQEGVDSMSISGAGSSSANGIYVKNGESGGKSSYSKGSYFLYWSSIGPAGSAWYLYDGEGLLLYFSNDDTASPDLATFSVFADSAPPPTVDREGQLIYPLFSKSGIKVDSINFSESQYRKILDYDIQLSYFPDDYFTTYYGVTNPVDSWDFNESEDGLLNITHTISCKGFNTLSGASNAFQNARSFVNSKTGYQNMVNPHFICKNTYPDFYPCLDTFSEQINRIDGTYSITENYISDLEGTGFGVLRYTVDISSGISDFSTASVQGNIDGCKNQDLSPARARFKNTRFFDLVADVYGDAFGFVDLNSEAISSGITEDSINKKINFNINWDNDDSPNILTDIQTNITSGDSHINVGINGRFRSRGDIRSRYSNMLAQYSETNIFGLANDAYVNYLGGNVSYPLNPRADSSGVTRDPFTPSVSFQANFTNKEIPPNGFESFTRDITIKPSLRSVKPVALFDQNGTYNIIDLLFDRRSRVSINLNGTASPDETSENLTATMKSEGNLLLQNYGNSNSLKLESYNLSTGNLGDYSLSATWSFEVSNKIFNGTNYDQVNTLKIK